MKKLFRKVTAFATVLIMLFSTIQNIGATTVTGQTTMVDILDWGYTNSNGNILVHATVKNNRGSSVAAGFMAIGRNASGEIVEVRGSTTGIFSGSSRTMSVRLLAGSQISNVSVAPIGEKNSGSIDLLASGYRHENGIVTVTGVWQNNTGRTAFSHFLVLGRNANGQVVEVGNARSGPFPASTSQTFTVRLSAGSQITNVSIVPVRETNTGSVDLLASGHRYENGNVIVTGVLQNNTGIFSRFGMFVTGYDANGKAVEVDSSFGIPAHSGFSSTRTARLSAGSIVQSISIVPMDLRQDGALILLGTGYYTSGSNVYATAAVHNGTGSNQSVIMRVNGYDSSNRLVRTQQITRTITFNNVVRFRNVINATDVSRVEIVFEGDNLPIQQLPEPPIEPPFESLPETPREDRIDPDSIPQYLGDPIDVVSGNLIWDYTDLELHGAQGLYFRRHYNSQSTEDIGMGYGWRHSFAYCLELGENSAKVTIANGFAYNFILENGSFIAPANSNVELTEIHGGYRFVDIHKSEYDFDSTGNLTRIRDVRGNETNFEYADGLMVRASNRSGTITFEHTDGNITRISDSAGRSVSYNYDSSGNLVEFENPDGNNLIFTYDDAHNLLEVTDFNGNTFMRNTFSGGRVVEQYLADQGTMRFEYDPQNRRTAYTDPLGNISIYYYDENFRITHVEDSNGRTSQIFENGRLVSRTDPLGHTTTFEYDSNGNRIRTAFPDGLFEAAVFNERNQVTQATARDGSTVSMTYDASGNMTSFTDALGNTSFFEYDSDNNRILEIDAMGNRTTFSYDARGNCVSITNALGNTMSLSYDAVGRLVSVTAPNGATTVYEYSPAGKLLKIIDPYGNEQSFTVNGNGYNTAVTDFTGNTTRTSYNTMSQPVSVTNPLGNVVSFSYDAVGNLVTVSDALGNITRMTYDSNGRITSFSDALNNTWEYAYDDNGNLISQTDPLGGVHSFVYNELSLLTSSTDEAGNITTFSHDENGRIQTVTDANGGITRFSYNGNGQLTSLRDPLGNESSFLYDGNGNLVTETDPMGNASHHTYDALGRVSTITDPLNGVTTIAYDENGNISSMTNAEGGVTYFSHDLLGRIVSYTDTDNNTFTFTYDASGNVVLETDARGNSIAFVYDAANQLIEVTDQVGGQVRYSHDANGNIISIVDQRGAETQYVYDANNQVVSIRDALGNSIAIEYDALGRIRSTTDANGNTTRYTYSPNGLLRAVIDAEGNTASFSYDAVGNLISETDPLGNVTTFARDAAGNITSVTNALGHTDSFTYNANGQITSVTNRNGHVTRYVYDANGNLVQAIDPDGGVSTFSYNRLNQLVSISLANNGQNQVTLYEYNGRGLVTRVINASGSEKIYVYDANGNLISQTDEDGYVTNYIFDARNLIESIAYADGSSVNFAYNERGELVQMVDWTGTTSFSLDLLGRITSVNDSNNRVVSYTYDRAGNQTSITYPDNSVIQYVYDRQNRLTSVIDSDNAVTTYVYDRASRLTSLNYPNGRSEFYTHDAIGQLLKTIETVNGHESILYEYSYDPMGNIISEFKRDSIAPEPEIVINRYNERNQLISKTVLDELGATVDVFTYQYDNRGNLLTVSNSSDHVTVIYQFDATNRMVSGVNGNDESSEYMFNGLGFLVNTITLAANGLTITDYVIDYTSPYQRVLAKYEDGGFIYNNVFGLDRISTLVVDGLNPADALKAYIQNDRLGSGRYASNAAGELIGFTDLDVWGNVIEKNIPTVGGRPANILNNFTNHEYDDVLNVYYAKARFYDPANHRMISEDDLKDGLNWYIYCLNNPLRFIDPCGNMTRDQFLFVFTPTYVFHGYINAMHSSQVATFDTARILYGMYTEVQAAVSEGIELSDITALMVQVARNAIPFSDGLIPEGALTDTIYVFERLHFFSPACVMTDDEVRAFAVRAGQMGKEIFRAGAGLFLEIKDVINLTRNAHRLASNLTPNNARVSGMLPDAGNSSTLAANLRQQMGLTRSGNTPGYQAQHLIPGQHYRHPAAIAGGLNTNAATNGVFLPDRNQPLSAMSRHQGSHPGYNQAVRGALDRIDLSRGGHHVSSEIARMQNVLRSNLQNGVPIISSDMIGHVTRGGTPIGTARVRAMWDNILINAGF